MDIDSPRAPTPPLPPDLPQADGAGGSGNAPQHLDAPGAPHKRKYDHLTQHNADSYPIPSEPSSPAPHPSSPPPPSSSPFPERSASSTPAPASTSEAQKVYIARTAPHLLGRPPAQPASRTPSLPPSGRSSPSDEEGRSTPDGTASTPTASNQSNHTLPQGYRGPALRKNDAEDFAPAPHLAPTVGSSTLYNTVNFAVNRNGWRYTAAGPASQHLPHTLFKTLETLPATVHWCWSDRSPFTKISAAADIVSTDKGFRGARTNIGVRQGEWYAEIEILPPEHLAPGVGAPGPLPAPMKDGSHVRLGWARREAPLNAPVGFDGYSYGFRDKTGDKVTLSRPLPYGQPFKAGDVVGMYIKLPQPAPPQDENDPANIRRERIPIRYKGQLYFESLEYPRTREMDQLMERSRKGNSIEEAHQGIQGTGVFEPLDPTNSASSEAVNGASAAAAVNGAGASGGASGSAKVKNRKTTAAKDKPSGPATPSLRPVPRIAGSKIGFVVNGVPQGIAFRDLFDFRPLRVKGFSNLRPATLKPTGRAAKQDPKKPEPAEPVINIRARENVFDDGALGYFPFVSCYGGARARLITGEHGFKFPPPADIEAALENASSAGPGWEKMEESEGVAKWKPLAARFEEHLAEMWQYDMQDEARAQAAAAKQAEEREKRNHAAKERYAAAKKKHAAALARNSAASSPHPEHEPDATEADTTITDQHDAHMDEDASVSALATVPMVKFEDSSADRPVEQVNESPTSAYIASSPPTTPPVQPALRDDDVDMVDSAL
ncbi:related to BRE2 - subunit of COMPASS (Set1C) complex [Moesziomyces antarcticus]|nr:related to BRE2 - subunit of COMPASS (Set1C) complex [Moesziomyces antarcticus]